MDPQTAPWLLQLGGLGAFAFVVWWELRLQRAERSADASAMREILTKQGEEISALLEYVRLSRAEREVTPHPMPAVQRDPVRESNRGYRAPSRPHGVDVVQRRGNTSSGDDD